MLLKWCCLFLFIVEISFFHIFSKKIFFIPLFCIGGGRRGGGRKKKKKKKRKKKKKKKKE